LQSEYEENSNDWQDVKRHLPRYETQTKQIGLALIYSNNKLIPNITIDTK